MDYLLTFADDHLFDSLYGSLVPSLFAPAWLSQSHLPRQALSLYFLTLVGITLTYFTLATLSYHLLFNPQLRSHPRFLPNQVRQEITSSLKGFPIITALTVPWFIQEVRGAGRYYEDINEYGWVYAVVSVVGFLVFTDTCIYWIHRWEHHPGLYRWLHKPHHKWIVPTPFASHAFHPLDGYVQGLPYHLFPLLFPLHKGIYLGLFVGVNFWTILIHDGDMITTGSWLEKIINTPAHHTLHHLYFNVNYGQYLTLSNRLSASYRSPAHELDPMREVERRAARSEKTQIKGEL